jgi:hypothetical protein
VYVDTNQLLCLIALATAVACVSRTVVYEEIFREVHDYCAKRSEQSSSLVVRKFFYLFTCDYCFSHYIAIGFIWLTNFKIALPDWRGSIIAFFALVFVTNLLLNLYARLKVEINLTKVETASKKKTA